MQQQIITKLSNVMQGKHTGELNLDLERVRYHDPCIAKAADACRLTL